MNDVPSNTAHKIVTLSKAKRRVAEWRQAGKVVAYTNGCFDLIHAGHARTLEHARGLADALIVGINSDESTRELKGAGRPIMDERDRAEVLAAFACVDLVVIFAELSSLPTIQALKPDIWVKGGDYDLSTVHQEERAFVESYGGRVALAGHVPGASTTDIIARVKRLSD
ncbi:MAG: adenylyltransferase/cytidyltransferase family protein [Armatimonadota bacterium]|jgi:D-beta-D-heptose 7-phosphate kinase/D-beta-D-heptose 1-phosphate adenosyltransferase